MSFKAQLFSIIGLSIILATVAFFVKRKFNIDLKEIFFGVFLAACALFLFKNKKKDT
jgi:uncharacterized membrane protein YhfC